jgi:hypothetical protein
MSRPIGLLVLWFAVASAPAQVTLSTVQGGITTPVAAAVSFGAVPAGWDFADIVFNISYTGSASAYYLTYFSLEAGTAFSVVQTDWPSLPAVIPPNGLNFTVRFEPNQVAESFPGALQIQDPSAPDSVYVLLTGDGIQGFTVVAANQPLSAGATVAFGNVQVGSSLSIVMTLANQTSATLAIGSITFQGTAFQLTGTSVAGAEVPSNSSAELQLVFTPSAAGPQQGTLTIGVASFPLTGTGIAPISPAYPVPTIQLTLAAPASAEQGGLSVTLASGSAAGGSGTVTLSFLSAVAGAADDPAVTFADGTRTAAFTVAEGASIGQFAAGPSVAFGTGTTAGTLNFALTLGSSATQASIAIPPALIGIDAAVAARNVACDPGLVYCTTTNVQLQVNGWDNTRTVSKIVFSFFNSSGNAISPGNITVSAGQAFQQYFDGSDMAGVFGLSAFFPVTGDADDVVTALVQLTNSVGTVESTQITF